MLFVFHLLDKPGTGELRARVRPAHKVYLGAKADSIAFAGPLLAEDGTTMAGSLLVIDFPSLAEAKAWLAGEPFMQAGVYGQSTVHGFSNLWPQKAGFPPA
ncbi:YciI family protein [Cupriavidus basilensis]|uniref:YciI family protein n=1 Tax=Cupriavidus basilensis TaxID=68895 RepID=UPI00157AA28C|nr:YciI family protein [Cupriavidus basilensis]NUA26895.1 YciI family protein [Cupriavidus basilensis]